MYHTSIAWSMVYWEEVSLTLDFNNRSLLIRNPTILCKIAIMPSVYHSGAFPQIAHSSATLSNNGMSHEAQILVGLL